MGTGQTRASRKKSGGGLHENEMEPKKEAEQAEREVLKKEYGPYKVTHKRSAARTTKEISTNY